MGHHLSRNGSLEAGTRRRATGWGKAPLAAAVDVAVVSAGLPALVGVRAETCTV